MPDFGKKEEQNRETCSQQQEFLLLMSQAAPGHDSSRGPAGRIEQYYDVGSRLTADACGAGGEVMRG